MSEYTEEDEFNGALSEEDLFLIQEEYRKQKLKETLIGPMISTAVHICLLVVAATLFQGQVIEKNETVEITPVQEEVPQEEPPPPPPPPEIPPPEPQEVVSHDPQVTSDAVPDAADLIGAIDDVSDEPPSTDDSAEADLVSDVKPSASSIMSSKMFGGRSSAGRAGALKSYGGSVAAQGALHKALQWLAKVQKPDGSWGEEGRQDNHNGLTGLGLLVFLAHGETPKSKNYGNTVSSAIKYLASSSPKPQRAYGHGIKTYALAEAYAMTGMYSLRGYLEECLKVIVKGQQAPGGYTYYYDKDHAKKQDLSVGGWNYQALKAAKGAGIDVEGMDAAIEKSIKYLKKMGGASKEGQSFVYNQPVKPISDNARMRAVGVLCLQLFGEGDAPEIKDDLERIATVDLAQLSWKNPKKECLYGWYYATQCMFQAGGKYWKAWNKVFQKELKNNQNPIGYWEYPIDFHGPKSDIGKKVYATCLASLMLTVYYRYLPMTSKGANKKVAKSAEQKRKEKAAASGDMEIDIF